VFRVSREAFPWTGRCKGDLSWHTLVVSRWTESRREDRRRTCWIFFVQSSSASGTFQRVRLTWCKGHRMEDSAGWYRTFFGQVVELRAWEKLMACKLSCDFLAQVPVVEGNIYSICGKTWAFQMSFLLRVFMDPKPKESLKKLWVSIETNGDVIYEVRAHELVYNIKSYVSLADREAQQAFLSIIEARSYHARWPSCGCSCHLCQCKLRSGGSNSARTGIPRLRVEVKDEDKNADWAPEREVTRQSRA